MASQLNIKDPTLVARVRDLAQRRGQPVTATLRAIVDQEWERDEADIAERMRRLDALVDEVRAGMPDDARQMTSKEIMDSIYDDDEPDGFAR